MAWFDRWRRKSSELTLDQLTRAFLLKQSEGLPVVTPDSAMESPTVFAIVHGMSRTLAQLPIDIIRRTGKGRRPVPDHPLHWLLNVMPNKWQTRCEYWSQVGSLLLLHGEAVIRKAQGGNGIVTQLLPLMPGEVEWSQQADFTLEYAVSKTGQVGKYPQSRMHHIRSMTLDGMSGISPVDHVKDAIALEIASQRMALNLFGNGAIPNIVLEHPAHFRDEEALKRFKASWQGAFGGGRRGTAVLEDGIKANQLQLSNEESQFLEARQFQRTVIAGAWGIPPHKIGDLSRATWSNIEQQSLEFVVYALMPYISAIEAAMHRDLLPDSQKEDHQIKFNVGALLRGDLKTRSEALKIQKEAGVISVNEWRRLEDMEPIEGGDEYGTPKPDPAPQTGKPNGTGTQDADVQSP